MKTYSDIQGSGREFNDGDGYGDGFGDGSYGDGNGEYPEGMIVRLI